MRYRIMDILVCPHCREKLDLIEFSTSKNNFNISKEKIFCKNRCHYKKLHKETDCAKCFNIEIKEGLLTCKCGRFFPVINGVPRMLPDSLRKENLRYHRDFFEKHRDKISIKYLKGASEDFGVQLKSRTAQSFGFQWNRFREMFPVFETNFRRYIGDIKPGFFKGKLSLDVGCGFGRHTYYSTEYGSETVGMDLSEAVEAAYTVTRKQPHSHIVQGDIFHLPFTNDFDFIFSIGVIHHLPDPKKGYLELAKFAKKGSSVFIWIYGREGRTFKLKFVEGVVRKFTLRMPHKALYYACYIPAMIYHISNIFFNGLNKYRATRPIANIFPFRGYAPFPFRIKHADAFDLLATPVNNYYTKKEAQDWLDSSKLKNSWITDIDHRSWRIYGEK